MDEIRDAHRRAVRGPSDEQLSEPVSETGRGDRSHQVDLARIALDAMMIEHLVMDPVQHVDIMGALDREQVSRLLVFMAPNTPRLGQDFEKSESRQPEHPGVANLD